MGKAPQLQLVSVWPNLPLFYTPYALLHCFTYSATKHDLYSAPSPPKKKKTDVSGSVLTQMNQYT